MMKIDTFHANGTLLSSVDTRDLGVLKDQKFKEVNSYRDSVLDSGIWYMGYLWGSDGTSRANITGAVSAFTAGIPLPDAFTWRDNNNNNVAFDLTNMITLGGLLLGYVNIVYNASWTMKTVLDSLVSLDDVDNFIVSQQAWPSNNMDGSKPSE